MPHKHFYEFGPYRIDVGLNRLGRGGETILLPPKAFDLLLLLARNADRVIGKAELMQELWPKTFVEEGNLTQHVYTLRKALGDQISGQPYIETVARRGYRLVADVREVESGLPAEALPQARAPSTAPADIETHQRKPATVLHCTIANAAGLFERLGSTGMHDVMRRLMDLATDELGRYEGVVSQQHADGFVGVFGAPAVHEDDGRRAVLAAHAIQRRLRELPLDALDSGDQQLELQMGIHSGPLVIGRSTDDHHGTYSAVGETMRIADLVQQFAEPGVILISEATRRAIEKYGGVDVAAGPSPPGVRAYRIVGVSRAGVAMRRPARVVAPFVGRERELIVLEGLLAEALSGKGQAVSVVGEPGMGKSRLLDEFTQPVVSSGRAAALEGRSVSYGSLIPYLPLAEILRALCAVAEADPPPVIQRAVDRLVTEHGLPPDAGTLLQRLLGVVDGTAGLEALSPEALKSRTFDALRLLLLKVAGRQPLVLVVEDVHWIDRTSEEFLATLVDRLGGAPVLFVATHRPGYRVTWLDRSYGTQITLSPLAPAESARLVEAVAREQLGADVSQAILRRGEGNPFFLEELARTMIEHSAGTDTIPQTVQGVIMARIDRLADVPKRLLQTASVIGREVPLGLLGRIWSGPADFDFALVELCRLEFLHERPAGDERAYVFKHALTQDVAYDSLLARTRGELHRRAAKALEAIHGDRLDDIAATLAYHYARTDLLSEAVTWLTRAADGAARVYANAEAILHLDLAARRLQRLPEGPERDRRMLDVALRQAHSLYFLGRFRDSVDALAPHEARLARLDDAALIAACSFWLAHMYTRIGDPRRAGDHAQRAIDAATTAGDDATIGKAYGVLATESYWAGRPTEAIAHGMRSIRLLEKRREHRWWLGMSHFYLAFSHKLIGDFKAALADTARADAAGRDLGDPRLQTYAGYMAGWVEASRGNHEEAVKRCRRSLDLAPDRVSRAYASLFLGFALLEKGDHEQAQDMLRPILPELEGFPIPHWLALGEIFTGEALRLQRRLDEAAGFVERGMQNATRVGYAYAMGFAHRIAGRIARDRGLVPEASSQLRQALEIFEQANAVFEAARTRLDLAEVAAGRGDRTEARGELTAAARTFQSLGVTAYGDRTAILAASLGLAADRSLG